MKKCIFLAKHLRCFCTNCWYVVWFWCTVWGGYDGCLRSHLVVTNAPRSLQVKFNKFKNPPQNDLIIQVFEIISTLIYLDPLRLVVKRQVFNSNALVFWCFFLGGGLKFQTLGGCLKLSEGNECLIYVFETFQGSRDFYQNTGSYFSLEQR